MGSSPRLRGARLAVREGDTVIGIIPALAGSTGNQIPNILRFRDHPRACGEHHVRVRTQPVAEGSSPRLRGAPFLQFDR